MPSGATSPDANTLVAALNAQYHGQALAHPSRDVATLPSRPPRLPVPIVDRSRTGIRYSTHLLVNRRKGLAGGPFDPRGFLGPFELGETLRSVSLLLGQGMVGNGDLSIAVPAKARDSCWQPKPQRSFRLWLHPGAPRATILIF
jgi:hypothetical protein